VLLRLPIQLAGRLFDGDVAELSNVNRQLLYRRSDFGFKVDIVKRFAESFTPVPEPFTASASTRFGPLSRLVLVGVDDIPARWDVQRASRGWLGVGATSHFSASISSHEPGAPCAGCLHPRDEGGIDGPIPTVSFVSFWAGLVLAVQFLRAIGGSDYSARRRHLWLSPLRLDQANAALWLPIAPRRDCPVSCSVSQRT
jgi:molybdopterin/thiamine biosynthesis adenylyltransferase